MPIITTYIANVDRTVAAPNAAKGIAFTNNTICYAVETRKLRMIDVNSEFSITDLTMTALNEIYNTNFIANDKFLHVDSYRDNLILLSINEIDNSNGIRVSTINLSTSVLVDFQINSTNIDFIKNDGNFFMLTDKSNDAVFSFDANNPISTIRKWNDVESISMFQDKIYAVLTESGQSTNIYWSHATNFNNDATLTSSNMSLVANNVDTILHIAVYDETLIAVSSNGFRQYELDDYSLKWNVAHSNSLTSSSSIQIDSGGHVMFNESTSLIYDALIGTMIQTTKLSHMNLADLQSQDHIKAAYPDTFVAQSATEIRYYTKISESLQATTISNLTSTISTSANIVRKNNNRSSEFIMKSGSHAINFSYLNNNEIWTDEVDVQFYGSIGFDLANKNIEETVRFKCKLYVDIDSTSEIVELDLTNIVKNSDLLSNKYSLKKQRLCNNQDLTFEQYIDNRQINWSNTQYSMIFEFNVLEDIRKNRHSIVNFQLLHTMLYATSKIKLT